MLESREKRKASGDDANGSGEMAMTVGRYLKTEREAQGQDLPQVAEMLRIHRSYLQAIEEGEIEQLPGPTYAVGFVRTYAEHLGLDGNKVAERFKEEGKVPKQRAQLVFPSPMPEGQIPSLAVLLIAAVLLLVAYGGWVFVSSPDGGIAEMVPALSDRFAALVNDGEEKGDETAKAVPPVAPAATPAEKATETESDQATQENSAPTPTVSSENDSPPPKPEAMDTGSSESAPEAAVETASAAAEKPIAGSETESGSGNAPATSEASSEAAAAEKVASVVATAENTGASAVVATTETEPAEAAKPASENAQEASKELPAASETQSAADTAAQDSGEPKPDTVPAEVDKPKPVADKVGLDGLNAAAPTVVGAATSGESEGDSTDTAAPTALQPSEEDGPRVYGEVGDSSRITIRAIVDSWVEVRDGEGELLLTRVLREGDQYHVPDRSGLTLVTGNAGGLEFDVDGEKVPEIGPLGTVRRNVRLEPQALKDGTASTR